MLSYSKIHVEPQKISGDQAILSKKTKAGVITI